MASSNRHWPSMFKSKPCNNQHKSSILSNSCGHSSGCEERTPDPKPRWNPKPEQIRILEAIFNSGLVNPPRDEIRRIRTQLQEYGNVGDANVFYWFQNRKSRSKHKQRALQAKTVTTTTTTTISASSSSSASSSDNHKNNNNYNIMSGENFNGNSSNNSINNYFQQYTIPHNNNHYNLDNNTIHEIIPQEPIYHPLQQNGLYFASINNIEINNSHHDPMLNPGDPIHVGPPSDQTVHGLSSLFHEDILKIDEMEKLKFQCDDLNELSSLVTSTSSPSRVSSIPTPISSCIDHILGEAGESTVFINGMAIGIPNTPVNVKEEFGEGVMLVHTSTGHAVVTDELGVTLYPLQHGASYHLVDITHVVSSLMLHNLDTVHDHLDSEFPYQI